MSLTKEWVTVTPEMAKEFLKRNTPNNRKIKQRRLSRIVALIERGDWMPEMGFLAFDRDGLLMDGQHRLAALVMVGEPLAFEVKHGFDPEEIHLFDHGQPRTVADSLTVSGYKSARDMAAAARLWHSWLGSRLAAERGQDSDEWDTWTALETVSEYRDLLTAAVALVTKERPSRQECPVAASVRSLVYCILVHGDYATPAHAEAFLKQVSWGAPVSVIKQLRGTLWKLHDRPGGVGHNVYPLKTGMVLRAWNGWVRKHKRVALMPGENRPMIPDHIETA